MRIGVALKYNVGLGLILTPVGHDFKAKIALEQSQGRIRAWRVEVADERATPLDESISVLASPWNTGDAPHKGDAVYFSLHNIEGEEDVLDRLGWLKNGASAFPIYNAKVS